MVYAGLLTMNSDGDIYGKGAAILHTLPLPDRREETVFQFAEKDGVPDPHREKITNGASALRDHR